MPQPNLPDYQALHTQLEAEVRRTLTPRTSAAPAGAGAAPHLSPALLGAILQELPELYAIIKRVIEASYGTTG